MSKKRKSSIGTDPFKEKEEILKGFFKSEEVQVSVAQGFSPDAVKDETENFREKIPLNPPLTKGEFVDSPPLEKGNLTISPPLEKGGEGGFEMEPSNEIQTSDVPETKSEVSPIFADSEMQSLIKDFAAEVKENLEEIDSSLVALEGDTENEELLNKVFRVMHTVKGSAGFLGFERMQRLAHRAEDLLNKLRNKEMVLSPEINDAILSAGDILKKLLHEIETGGKEISDVTAAIENLSAMLEGKKTETFQVPSSKFQVQTVNQIQDRLQTEHGTWNMEHGTSKPVQPQTIAQQAQGAATPDKTVQGQAPAPQVKISSSTIRIDVDKLDALMNLAGELVLSRNRQIQISKDISSKYPQDEAVNTELSASANQLDLLTAEIQMAVMKTRMLPVSTLFDKFTRVVRDLSRMLGKEVDLVISGGDTEIDKNILEGLGDPMVHLVRNSLDHGIESPQDRIKKGKNMRGTVSLNSYHEGGYVVIEIKDDGKGMDPLIIKNKAVEKGIISRSDADSISDKEALKLIFAPGFSTAEKVSNVSGRGVGMDVVKTNVESLKGIIEVDSSVGKGSAVRLLIPLTLAILQTLLCKVGSQKFAIPLISIRETLEISESEITTIRGQEVIRLRDEILPVLRLANIFEINVAQGFSPDANIKPKGLSYNENKELSIIILRLGTEKIGLVVDDRLGKEEVVVKSLNCLKDIYTTPHISGATILGDGTVTLILDVEPLIKIATQSRVKVEKEAAVLQSVEDEGDRALIVDDGMAEQYAIPLRFVKKVELISAGEIEIIGSKEAVKYYNEALPVTRLYYLTQYPPAQQFSSVYMIIISEGGRRGGLIVNRMHGLKRIKHSEATDSFTNAGVLRSVIIDNRVTLILNDKMIIENIYSAANVAHGFSHKVKPEGLSYGFSQDVYLSKKTILLVDDSSTHRSIQGKVVQEAGYDVIYAEDGEEGLKKLSGISLVLTDLEMPKMNGYEFTKRIKEDNPGLPVVMLTSRDGEEDRLMGLEAGVDEYLTKMNKEELIYTLKKLIG